MTSATQPAYNHGVVCRYPHPVGACARCDGLREHLRRDAEESRQEHREHEQRRRDRATDMTGFTG